ncbi:hypothetical protein B0H16DRAFT_1459530 [Mycena metata]|uniref:Uncharacterized protein n=1 Tax=Mycena metata TaxID=1033252 RepID=A0AAD7J2P7_9AGAR|nr:hypothetical protein B0H16DRAFT_1459530 [Mycena metata]
MLYRISVSFSLKFNFRKCCSKNFSRERKYCGSLWAKRGNHWLLWGLEKSASDGSGSRAGEKKVGQRCRNMILCFLAKIPHVTAYSDQSLRRGQTETTMAKPKKTKAPSKPARKPEDPEKREKRLQKLAEYRRRPEAREKQRVLMAERRAAVKARRRQWDPPKKSTSVVHDAAIIHDTPVSPSQEQLPEDGDASITSAEHVAIHMLLELADATGPKSQGLYVSSSSHHSSLEAVQQERIYYRRVDPVFITEKLPPNASPSKLQKKLYRDLGILGPLNWVQQAQMHVATLGLSGSSVEEADDLMVPVDNRGPSFLTMGSRRWERIWEWREGVEHEIAGGEQSENEMDWVDDAERVSRRQPCEGGLGNTELLP